MAKISKKKTHFKGVLLSGNLGILIQTSEKFVTRDPVGNKSALV